MKKKLKMNGNEFAIPFEYSDTSIPEKPLGIVLAVLTPPKDLDCDDHVRLSEIEAQKLRMKKLHAMMMPYLAIMVPNRGKTYTLCRQCCYLVKFKRQDKFYECNCEESSRRIMVTIPTNEVNALSIALLYQYPHLLISL